MWISLALLAAFGSAGTTLALKRAVAHGGAVLATVAFRLLAGLLLVAVTSATHAWIAPTPGFWRALALAVPPEIAGMLCLTLALRAGDVSLVQPILGLLPLFVMIGGALFLHEVPTPGAAAGVLLVAAGVYCVGLRAGGSPLEPLRALARSRASWLAVGAALAWSLTTVLHKVGIAEVGPLAWASSLVVVSALALALLLPLAARRHGALELPSRPLPWLRLLAAASLFFTVQQVGLHRALVGAQAGYVVAVASTSILIAGAVGVLLFGERGAAAARLGGSAMVTAGAALIALFG